MLEDYLCLHQTRLEVLSQKDSTVLQNNYKQYIRLEDTNFSFLNRYKTGKTAVI